MPGTTELHNFDEMVSVLAINAPHALILDWWRRLGQAIDEYLAVRGLPVKSSVAFKEEVLAADPHIGTETTAQIKDLRRLRNAIAHEKTKLILHDEAAEYAQKAQDLVWLLAETPPNPFR